MVGPEISINPRASGPIDSKIFGVPTLEEMILLVQGLAKSHGRKMGLYIEIKGYDFHRKHYLDPGFKLLEVLNNYSYLLLIVIYTEPQLTAPLIVLKMDR